MGKRYYCDYCDRSFQDTLHNRKKHLNGVQHQRSKKAWLDNFRDAAAILQEERSKQPCRKFQQTGQCVFGPSCRYSHSSEKDIMALEQQIEDERCQKADPELDEASPQPSVDEWLSRREKNRAALMVGRLSFVLGRTAQAGFETKQLLIEREMFSCVLKAEEEKGAESSDVPPFLLSVPDLPPSLLPPQHGGWRGTIHNDWG
ncbi:zinc finger matrin-type protein 5 isoform X1 [Colossoma macropomum]|uniref:zinc finger matrin-type protein 5 isoform X1 n=1 Tax=Colossoma macropomum TaxID=42526 RepID=UPI001864C976|nr:zinc finger matrin-type protein 5 isoform X1 [Colossoma macropomum]